MSTVQELKGRVCHAIEARRGELAEFAEKVLRSAELGYRECETSALVQQQYDLLGIKYESGLAITGVKADLSGRAGSGPRIAVLGELDALPIPDHPDANSETGAAHACGHNAQTAMVVAVGIGLVESGILPQLSGNVALLNVPAEELVDLEYRQGLKKEGIIHYLVGKPELIRLGAFDDIDMSIMVHHTGKPDLDLGVGMTLNGCIVKAVVFRGKGSHAGVKPWAGVNALNAANIAFNAIHSQRETFRDEDTVRVHWIITSGGTAVNVVPAEVRVEMFVRARTIEALTDADVKTDRALKAGAMALGAQVEIASMSGYLPIVSYPELDAVFRENAEQLVGKGNVVQMPHEGGSTDLGDLSHIIPAIHPVTGGARGSVHTNEWHAGNVDDAVLRPAKAIAMTITDLLYDGARRAREVLNRSPPPMTKDQYLQFLQDHERAERYSFQ